ncbi:MAG TPA: helix-turn-helix domain-containing protein, partial [Planctomycetaceae bacterium]|nr:helix-turn-helix domain-containing protein [Planctomycetaceae bacterium]
DKYCQAMKRGTKSLTREAVALLEKYHWPGNVRELENTIERAVILGKAEVIEEKDIQFSSLETPMEPSSESNLSNVASNLSLGELEQQHILRTLDETGWNKSQAAQILGIERSTLDRKLKKYQVERPQQ